MFIPVHTACVHIGHVCLPFPLPGAMIRVVMGMGYGPGRRTLGRCSLGPNTVSTAIPRAEKWCNIITVEELKKSAAEAQLT